jgi:uracil-DNA glycosylase
MKGLSLYRKHVKQWENCTLCELCETRTKIVLAKGNIPADILLIGEAPGPSEDLIGYPFCGPAGHLLENMIQTAGWNDLEVRRAFTNLVGCIPKDESTGEKFAEPSKASIKACSPRVLQMIKLCKPKVVICVGKLSGTYIRKLGLEIPIVEVIHPAAILRADITQQGLAIQRTVIMLCDALEYLT